MRLKDTELDVARMLEAAGLGTLAAPEPTLFAGPYPASAPDAFIACRHTDSEAPEKHLAGTGLALHTETVLVMVRGTREPSGYTEGAARARAAWEFLYDVTPAGYVLITPGEGQPRYLGEDEDQRPRWSFSVSLQYYSTPSP